MRLQLHTCALLAGLSLSSCATMFSGTTTEVSFDSYPPGQGEVIIDGVSHPLPAIQEVSKKLRVVDYRSPDGEIRTVELDTSTNGGYVLMDILFTPGFGLVGIVIDGASSAWTELPANVVYDWESGERHAGIELPDPSEAASS